MSFLQDLTGFGNLLGVFFKIIRCKVEFFIPLLSQYNRNLKDTKHPYIVH